MTWMEANESLEAFVRRLYLYLDPGAKFICNETNNTAETIARHEMHMNLQATNIEFELTFHIDQMGRMIIYGD